MTDKPLRSAAAVLVALIWIAVPIRAQLPTMSDVDRGGATPAAGPLPQWDVAVVKPHAVDDGSMSWRTTADGLSLAGLPLGADDDLHCVGSEAAIKISSMRVKLDEERHVRPTTAKVSGEDDAGGSTRS